MQPGNPDTRRGFGYWSLLGALILGGLAIGALFASFIRMSNRERQLIEAARAKERILEEELQSSAASESERERGHIPPPPPLDDDNSSVH